MPPLEVNPVDRIHFLVNYLTTSKAKKQLVKSNKTQENTQTEDSSGSTVLRAISRFFTTASSSIEPTQAEIALPQQDQNESLSIVSASNELVELIANHAGSESFSLRTLVENRQIEEERLLRAGMIATVYGRGVDQSVRKVFRNKFMYLTRHDDLPVNRKRFPFESRVALEEVLWCFDHLFDLYSNFSHFHISTQRPNKESLSMLEQFIRHVNGSTNYKAYSPTQFTYKSGHATFKGTIDDFPGPGIIIKGLGRRAKLFPKGFVETSFPQNINSRISPKQKVENEYRKILVKSEKDLPDTEFALFRGLVIIRNPKRMVIDGRKYALIIYNDHFPKDNQEIALLIPDELAQSFISEPLRYINGSTNFHPEVILQRYGNTIIVPTYESALGGFDKTFPYGEDAPKFYAQSRHYDKWGREYEWDLCLPERRLETSETFDTKGYIHRTHDFAGIKSPRGDSNHDRYWSAHFDSRNYIPDKLAHDEVRNCLFFAHSQFDLLKAAFRLYNFGYEYNPQFSKWARDEFRLLQYGITFRHSERFPVDEKPLLVGVEQGRNSHFTTSFIRDVGTVDTRLMLWQKSTAAVHKSGIDTKMLPGEIPMGDYDLKDARTWKYFEGVQETANWLEFQANAYAKKVEPIFYYGQSVLREQLLDIMRR